MSDLLFLVGGLGLLGHLRWNFDTTCEYYTRDMYVKVMGGNSLQTTPYFCFNANIHSHRETDTKGS